VKVFKDSYATASYSMTASFGVTASVSVNGGAVRVGILRPAQDARVTFSGQQGQTVTVTVQGATGSRFYMYAYAPNGNELRDTLAYDAGALKVGPLPTTGIYTIRVNPNTFLANAANAPEAADNASLGTYTVSVSSGAAVATTFAAADFAPSRSSTIYLPVVGKQFVHQPLPPQSPGPTAWQSLMTTLQAQSSNTAARAEVTKYYAFNGSRAAIRQANNEVFYLFGDHLGSSSLVVDWQGRKISEMRYAPWGETRWAWELDGERYSNRLYTSQIAQNRNYVGQLYDYGARFVSPMLGRFLSPDIFNDGGKGSSKSLNRYLYAQANPIRYNDPSGHCAILCTALIGAGIGAALEYGKQVYNNYQANGNDLTAALTTNIDGSAIVRSAIAGGVAGATGFGIGSLATGTLAKTIGAGALEGAVTGIVDRTIKDESTSVGNVLFDAGVGAFTGGVGYGIKKVGQLLAPDGIVYKRTNPFSGDEYVGQAKSPERFLERQTEHDKKLGVQHSYEILGRAKPGMPLNVLEESMIRQHGGIKKYGGTPVNKRHQLTDKVYRANGGNVDWPYPQ
jgi:RHS repeat-associated protein